MFFAQFTTLFTLLPTTSNKNNENDKTPCHTKIMSLPTQDHTKIEEKTRIFARFPKKNLISSTLKIRRFPLKTPQKVPIFNKYRSKYRQRRQNMRFFTSILRFNTTIYVRRSTNPEYDENINYQLSRKTEVGRKDKRQRAKKRIQKRKRIFLL